MKRSATASPAMISVQRVEVEHRAPRATSPSGGSGGGSGWSPRGRSARRYLMRLATTKPVSRNGTARTTSGPTSAIKAFVFSVPSMITAPSSSPSRLDPQSPMNTDAGWKLKIRKPSAAPQVIAARMPAVLRPRSKAMIENASAAIAHTPAARPSTPSEKLTTFISSTSANTVSGPAEARRARRGAGTGT